MADNTEPLPTTVTTAVDPNEFGATPANDDTSYDKAEAARLSNYSNPTTVAGSNEMETLNDSFAGATQAGSANNSTNNPKQKNTGVDKPGSRLQNPLGNFSSYTYQLSLYMVTPDAHTAFVASGRKNINAFTNSGANSGSGGAYLILQSGGVNTKLDKRPPGINYDYYIDDLRITNAIAGKETATSSNITKIQFNIVEPIGFSLITKLKRAREKLAKESSIPNIEKALDPSKHFYVLGIRFQGYDVNGEIANASKYFSDDTLNTSSDASGVYERFYDIRIQKMSFKLGTGSTTYAVTAVCVPSDIGLNIARGTVDSNIELVADTVGNALDGTGSGITSLFQTINANQAKAKSGSNSREFPDVYAVRWIGTGVDNIKSARLKSPANTDKKKSAPSEANNSTQVTDATAQRAVYDAQKVKISITQGMPILQAIQKIIKQSSYLESAMETLFKSEETPNEDTNSPDKVEQKDPPSLRWYNVSTEIEVIGFDSKINDFAYKITYVIQPYDTPAAVSPYGRASKYYGPHKKYQYWYTGKNTEILSYEQQYDNTYFNITFNPNGDPATSGGAASVPQLGGKPTPQDRTGYITPGAEAQNTYVNSLFDPGAYSKAKITILGDPDYLMRETAPGINEVYKQFYQSDGYTINPNGGQVFVEIEFNEGIDYDNNKGIMDINDSIFFWNYPDNIRTKIKGVSYYVTECESTFKGGKFTQSLSLVLNTMPEAIESAKQAADDKSYDAVENARFARQGNSDVRTGNSQGGSTPTPGSNTNTTSAGTGLMADDATGVDAAVQTNAEADAELLRESRRGTVAASVAPTGNALNSIVANDDSVSNSGSTQAGYTINQTSGSTARNTGGETATASDVRTGQIIET